MYLIVCMCSNKVIWSVCGGPLSQKPKLIYLKETISIAFVQRVSRMQWKNYESSDVGREGEEERVRVRDVVRLDFEKHVHKLQVSALADSV